MVMEKQFEEIIYSRYQARIRDMKILKVDEGFEQILGYSAEDVERLQLHVKDIMLDEDWEDIILPYYPFVIGKNKNLADYTLQKDTVSRFHLRIDDEGENYTVTDLNSTNGTRVNGKALDANETSLIKAGDEIYIADVGFIFE